MGYPNMDELNSWAQSVYRITIAERVQSYVMSERWKDEQSMLLGYAYPFVATSGLQIKMSEKSAPPPAMETSQMNAASPVNFWVVHRMNTQILQRTNTPVSAVDLGGLVAADAPKQLLVVAVTGYANSAGPGALSSRLASLARTVHTCERERVDTHLFL